MAFFQRVSESSFRATEHVSGAWNLAEQHIAPALGLLMHVVETDLAARRDDPMVVGRLSYDILGTLPVDIVDCTVSVLRPGRTIELVEARLGHGGRDAVILRCWLMQPGDTESLAGTPLQPLPSRESLPPWHAAGVWQGGFIASTEVHREAPEVGRARLWVRSTQDLVEGEQVSPLAHLCRLLDIANGMAVRVDPREVLFPNLDLTAHFFTQPRGEWLGLDTTVSFGPGGVGLTSSILHDENGPFGTLAQVLTVRTLTP